jgi:putative acetyltransferase
METAKIFFDAIHEGTHTHYNLAQRLAWAPHIPTEHEWSARLQPQSVYVAENCDGELTGFMSLTPDCCIDLAFVQPALMGKGIAKALYDTLEVQARENGLVRLWAEASYAARQFFTRQGWIVIEPQIVRRSNEREVVSIPNFKMEKSLR